MKDKCNIDYSIKITKSDLRKYIGKTFESNICGQFKVIGIGGRSGSCKLYVCEFIDTGYQKLAQGANIRVGSVRDPYYPMYYGVGFIGENRESYKNICKHPLYKTWISMIARCYDKQYPTYSLYGGNNVCVDERWYNFGKFSVDYYSLPGYMEDQKLQLDKDIIGCDKIYSPKTCCLVSCKLNSFFTYEQNTNTSGRIGARLSTDKKYYMVGIGCGGVTKYIGKFTNIHDASNAYWNAKLEDLKNRFSDIDPVIYFASVDKLIRDAKSEGVELRKEEL